MKTLKKSISLFVCFLCLSCGFLLAGCMDNKKDYIIQVYDCLDKDTILCELSEENNWGKIYIDRRNCGYKFEVKLKSIDGKDVIQYGDPSYEGVEVKGLYYINENNLINYYEGPDSYSVLIIESGTYIVRIKIKDINQAAKPYEVMIQIECY